jgi:hypothetical protein
MPGQASSRWMNNTWYTNILLIEEIDIPTVIWLDTNHNLSRQWRIYGSL